jgi:flagellar motor protein MotB
MSDVETVSRDSRSYRHGLVLGLTMAEVFLLLIFALLIAMATLWKAERDKRVLAEQKHGVVLTDVEINLLAASKSAIDRAGQAKVEKALDSLKQGRDLEALTPAEKEFIQEVRQQQGGVSQSKISEDWRVLTRAAKELGSLKGQFDMTDAVKKAAPDEKDPSRIGKLVSAGIAAEKNGEHDWPPIININEAKRRTFERGKAELTPDLEELLRNIIAPSLRDNAEKFGVRTIEVIGHTDETRIAPRPSNLDAIIIDVANGAAPVSTLTMGDNAGLGLGRAVAVIRTLKQDPRLKDLNFLPMSAGQLIDGGERMTGGGGGDDATRRRIEIRLRRPNNTVPTTTSPAATDASGRNIPR